jgi:predicted nucleic acid-binding protein
MTAYVDSSILLRRILGQANALSELPLIRRSVSSRLVEVECLRTLDRLRIEGRFPEAHLAKLRGKVYDSLGLMEIIEVSRSVLARAALPTATSLGTLDAIHLSSALAWRDRSGTNPVFATHDQALALAAGASGFRVLGA